MSFHEQLLDFWADQRTRSILSKCGIVLALGVAGIVAGMIAYGDLPPHQPSRREGLLALFILLALVGSIAVACIWTIFYFIRMQPLGLQRVSLVVVAIAFFFSLFGDASWLQQYLDGSFQFLDKAIYVSCATAGAAIVMIAGAFLVSWVLEGFKAQK